MDSGALVACGSAGRELRDARISRGWLVSEDVEDVMSPTPDGVGVSGGGLMGDSDDEDAAAPLRFFGKGVAGRSGIANSAPLVDEAGSSCCAGAVSEALLLRFLGAAVGFFSAFVYFATLSFPPFSDVTGALVLATRAERLRDIATMCSRRCRVLTVKDS